MTKLDLRDYQEKIVEKTVEALSSGHSVVVNAPTGTGKTVMGLETVRRLGKKAFVYVRTISQYSSWERDAVKLGMSFSGLMRKGEFCRIMKKPYTLWCTACASEVSEDDVEHIKKHKKFIERRYRSPSCYIPGNPYPFNLCEYRLGHITATAEDQEEAGRLAVEVARKIDEMLPRLGIKGTANWFRDNKVKINGKEYEVCVRDLVDSLNVDVKIYSYIYFFLGLRRPEPSDDVILIFDEAHNLDDFNVNSVTLTVKEVERYFDSFGDTIRDQAVREFREFVKDPDRGFSLSGYLEDEVYAKYRTVVQAWEERDRYYIERDTQNGEYVKVMPADPALWLSRLNEYRYILLSGTMPSKDYLRTVWGLSDFEYVNAMSLVSTTSLRDHFKGMGLYVVDDVEYTKAKRKDYRDRVSEFIREHVSKSGLNLVVLPSYEDLESYKSTFFGAFFEDSRPDVLDRVKKLPDGSLVFAVAGGKLSEGIEVLDGNGRSRVKVVFVVGVPLPTYKDPYLDHFIEVVSARAGKDPKSFKWTVLYEKAVIKVKQAIGRAIRGPQDSATIYLIDKRYTYSNVARLMNIEVIA